MSDKSQTLQQPVAFESSWRPSFFSYYFPSLLMTVLLLVVAFLVLTPLLLMILNSFQTARPGQPIVWGMEGWVKAFTTPGIVKAMTNTITLAATRQVIALLRRLLFRLADRAHRHSYERNVGIFILAVVFLAGVAADHGVDSAARP